MVEKSLTVLATDWRSRISELQVILEEIKPQLVVAEQQLSQQLVEISGFEFQVRSRLEPLSRRLSKLAAEIKSLQAEQRRLRDNFLFDETDDTDELYRAWRSSEEAGSAASGDFRYHEPPNRPTERQLSADQSSRLKELYRRLARRFHPDFAIDEVDREYRTGVMMAINAAYSAGDLTRLEELLDQPDPQHLDYADEQLAEALQREVRHCRQRIAEIEEELARLRAHPSYLLKKRVDLARRSGRDLLEELAADLRDKISESMVQRDILESEIEDYKNGSASMLDEALAEAVYNLGLEDVLVEDAYDGLSEWRDRNRDRLDTGDPDDDDVWDALRRSRNRRD